MLPIAHAPKKDNPNQEPHDLAEHLREVARLAAERAACFGASDWAHLAGKWHDLGKYRDAFQKYIRKSSGFDSEAHLEDSKIPGRVDHSTAGALYAKEKLGPVGYILAYLIAGHHAGLADWFGELDRRTAQENKPLLDEALVANIPADILEIIRPTSKFKGNESSLHLWIRMLFSCLVDADFLDTECYFDSEKTKLRSQAPILNDLLRHFDTFMQNKQATATNSSLNALRNSILAQCRNKAQLQPGIFTLTVPTGGGKTLSSLAFALTHAKAHTKRRVIYAIPYTSIIEQTAEVFRNVFKDLNHAVLEHHSNFDPDKETPESRLAAENWDAPLIVTTNVQLFESLFANRTSRCRKLHNIVNSVIILDEAQLLPPDFLQPILDVMNLLVQHYSVTFVLCTATQPALNNRENAFGQSILRGFENCTKIIDDESALYTALERVSLQFPHNLDSRTDWPTLAEELIQHPQILAIVNTRTDCRELHALMPPDTIHLSALMCGEHRSYVIADIRKKLKNGEPIRVISTQLIEAGVDVDFPVVYRALAGFDSIAQAAGRCNRENTLASKGLVKVFVPPKPAPRGLLRFGEEAATLLLRKNPPTCFTPKLFADYFNDYYSRLHNFDSNGISNLLTQDAKQFKIAFRETAQKFRLIDDSDTINLIVPYERPDHPEARSHDDIAQIQKGIIFRELTRRLQRFSVTCRRRQVEPLIRSGDVIEPVSGYFILRTEHCYCPKRGLLLEDTIAADPAGLIW